MKPITKQSDKKTAFTIIELLTVMSIIVILIGLLLPSLTMVKRYAKEVRQRAQFHSIDSAMELFSGDWGAYPPSNALDEASVDYCGAMKLCEAMVGQDLMGFNPLSHFRSDCTDGATNQLYATPTVPTLYPNNATNLKDRKGPYLQAENVNAYRLSSLYGASETTFQKDLFVLCDVYNRVRNQETGKGVGMPILYYKANTLNIVHDPCNTFPTASTDNGYIYNYLDNDKLVNLRSVLGPAGVTDPLNGTSTDFYTITLNTKITIKNGGWPFRPDSYILISAGFDGIYGTDDDIFDFEK